MNDLQTFETGTATVGESATVQNPFGAPLAQGGASNISTAQIVSREVAEMQAQIYLAKQFPRDQRQATDRILTACQRPGLASVAVYAYSRGGSNISGPSIRLAEEIARNWCNIECGWNEMERLDDMSKVRAFAWDKETNVLKTLFFFVPHYRSTKKGRNRITDERDLYELLANSAARRMRNCVLALIPGDVVDAAVEQCQKTMISKCDITPEGLLRLVESFESFGVTKRAIEARLGRRIDAIAPAQYLRLREIYASLRDGMSPTSPNRRRKRTRRRRRPKKSRRPSRRKKRSPLPKARSRRARKHRRATRRRPTLTHKRWNRKRRRFNLLTPAKETANFSAPRPLKRFASVLSTRRRSTNSKR